MCEQQNQLQHRGGKTTDGQKRKSLKFVPEFMNSEIYHLLEKEKKADMKALDPHVLHCRSNGKGRLRMGNWRHHSDSDQCHCMQSTFRLIVQLSGSNKSENQKRHPPPAAKPAESFQVPLRLIFQGDTWRRRADMLSVNDIQNKKTFQISM